MSRITVIVDIAVPPDVVWEDVSDLSSHVEWMADAESIEFIGSTTSGVGTRMRVETKVGPLRTTDLMTVTSWQPGRTIGVEHTGLVTGAGEFSLGPHGDGTRFVWSEDLTFPWWLGGPITAWLAKPVLVWVWRRNLERLKRRLERRRGNSASRRG